MYKKKSCFFISRIAFFLFITKMEASLKTRIQEIHFLVFKMIFDTIWNFWIPNYSKKLFSYHIILGRVIFFNKKCGHKYEEKGKERLLNWDAVFFSTKGIFFSCEMRSYYHPFLSSLKSKHHYCVCVFFNRLICLLCVFFLRVLLRQTCV